MTLLVRVAPAVVLASLFACGDPPASAPASASTPVKASSAPAEKSAAPAASAAPTAAASSSAAAPTGDAPGLATMFVGPPEGGLKDSKPIAGSDVVLALPEGWESVEDDSNYFTHFRKNELDVEKGVRGASIICGHFDDLADKNFFKRMVYTGSVEKDVWEEPIDGKVGVGPYPAKIAKGTGKQVSQPHERAGYYVHTTPPGSQGVLCVGTWPKSHPELEKEVVAALKGLKGTKGTAAK